MVVVNERDLFKTPKEIADQRAKGWTDWHPEDYCHKCGRRNIKGWYADSALWNRAAPVEVIWCPQCFVEAYEVATGDRPIWRLAPAELSDERSALIKSEAAMRHELTRLSDWHPHSAVGATRLIKAEEALDRIRQLHTPMPGDEYSGQRCRGCLAGYDPRTGELVQCAWPCPTIAALDNSP